MPYKMHKIMFGFFFQEKKNIEKKCECLSYLKMLLEFEAAGQAWIMAGSSQNSISKAFVGA